MSEVDARRKMRMRKIVAFSIFCASLIGGLSLTTHQIAEAAGTEKFLEDSGATGQISVMSYNIKGLPWPIAAGRSAALGKIGERLAKLRAMGTAPTIVVLQEGFIDAAAAIKHQGGYKYAAAGPAAAYKSKVSFPSPSKRFTEASSPLKGETEGKYANSGLRIFSDFPIVKVEQLAFPEYACAGYDCLANKGVLLAWIKVPSYSQPVAIIDTHLNSRRASGVSDVRADAAWTMQAKTVMQFIHAKIPSSSAVIFTGDFNVGDVPSRINVIRDQGGFLPGGREALHLAVATERMRDGRQLNDARSIIKRGKDWQWFRSGETTNLRLIEVSVPFGAEPDGTSLSDHLGYIASYRLE